MGKIIKWFLSLFDVDSKYQKSEDDISNVGMGTDFGSPVIGYNYIEYTLDKPELRRRTIKLYYSTDEPIWPGDLALIFKDDSNHMDEIIRVESVSAEFVGGYITYGDTIKIFSYPRKKTYKVIRVSNQPYQPTI